MGRDRQLVEVAVKTSSSALFLYPHEVWDVDLVLAAIPKTRGYDFRSFIDNDKVKQVFNQRSFVMAALEKNPMVLQFASRALKSDKGLVLHAVKLRWQALEYASSELQSDHDV